jgi:hypothetical protein
MSFKNIIRTYLTDLEINLLSESDNNESIESEEIISVLNSLMSMVCIRIMMIMTLLTNHCNLKQIKKKAVSYAFKIELKNQIFNEPLKNSIIPPSFLRLIYENKISSSFYITNECIIELGNYLETYILKLIQFSKKDNNLDLKTLLYLFENDNSFLHNFLISKIF